MPGTEATRNFPIESSRVAVAMFFTAFPQAPGGKENERSAQDVPPRTVP